MTKLASPGCDYLAIQNLKALFLQMKATILTAQELA